MWKIIFKEGDYGRELTTVEASEGIKNIKIVGRQGLKMHLYNTLDNIKE